MSTGKKVGALRYIYQKIREVREVREVSRIPAGLRVSVRIILTDTTGSPREVLSPVTLAIKPAQTPPLGLTISKSALRLLPRAPAFRRRGARGSPRSLRCRRHPVFSPIVGSGSSTLPAPF